jgi:hypothetical protein
MKQDGLSRSSVPDQFVWERRWNGLNKVDLGRVLLVRKVNLTIKEEASPLGVVFGFEYEEDGGALR